MSIAWYSTDPYILPTALTSDYADTYVGNSGLFYVTYYVTICLCGKISLNHEPIVLKHPACRIIIHAGRISSWKVPPKKINSLYGYRTPGSMASQERWDFAQVYSAWEMMKWGLALVLVSVTGLLIELDTMTETILGIAVILLSGGMLIFRTERELATRFRNTRR